MLLWKRQALSPISATICHDPIGSSPASECARCTICSGFGFLLLHTPGVRLVRELECRIILRRVLLERHIDRNLTFWKLEVMQVARCDLHRALHAHLNPELNAPRAARCFSCLVGSLNLRIYLTHNANMIRTFRGSGNTFLRLFHFTFTLL